MVEKLSERGKEAEPGQTHYDRLVEAKEQKIRARLEGKIVIKGSRIPWVQSKQALVRHYVNMENWHEMAVTDWEIFIQRINKHSGCHVHQGGLCIFVLEGTGYSVVDDVKYDWEEGDLILLPIRPGGVKHQHFNTDPDIPALWMAFRYEPMLDQVCIGITQVAAHPDWAGAKPH